MKEKHARRILALAESGRQGRLGCDGAQGAVNVKDTIFTTLPFVLL